MQIECKRNYNIKNLTSFKVGGIVELVYFPKTQAEFVYLLKNEKNAVVLGSCSNIIVSSLGCDSVIISTLKMNNFEIRGNKISAECGVKGPLLSQKALESKLTGFEFMIGFPGSIGGNLFMNAGAHGQSISDNIVSACVYDLSKEEVLFLNKSDMNFGYRHSIFQEKNYIVLCAEFELKRENPEKIKELMNRNIDFRKNVQPSLKYPNAGSIFRNPENDSAGRLLDKAGVKEINVPNVKVWEKHANFIVNYGDASSTDVLELMYKMYKLVEDTYTIKLVPEVRFIGKMTPREEEIWQEMYQKMQK